MGRVGGIKFGHGDLWMFSRETKVIQVVGTRISKTMFHPIRKTPEGEHDIISPYLAWKSAPLLQPQALGMHLNMD